MAVAKYATRTRVVVDGSDITDVVFKASLPRKAGDVETVELVLLIQRLKVEEDGTLVIYVDSKGCSHEG